jgi:FkbM family methyltransferase
MTMDMEFFSQNGQDKFLGDLFKYKKQGFFVDVGAYDGRFYSNTLIFEKDLDWKGICIEPNPSVFEKLKSNRQCTVINGCISEKIDTVKFLSVVGYGEMLSGMIDSFDHNHYDRIDKIIKEHGGSKAIMEISSIPLKDIFLQYSVTKIDYCNIDVEGGEMAVLNSIDFSQVRINVFTVENNNGNRNVREFLTSKGYSLIGKMGCDEIYELNSKRYDLMLKWRIKLAQNYLFLLFRSMKRKLFNK